MAAGHAYTTLDQDSSTAVIVKTKATVAWYMDGKINLDDLITYTMPIEDINKGYDLMKRGQSIRGVVLV